MAIYQLQLPVGADEAIERLLARTCPAHPGTTMELGVCDFCEVDAQSPEPTTRPRSGRTQVRDAGGHVLYPVAE